jgi:hypothetical protein
MEEIESRATLKLLFVSSYLEIKGLLCGVQEAEAGAEAVSA